MSKQLIATGDLYFLWHPGTQFMFSGYGLVTQPGRKDLLAGLLMVDRPYPVQRNWLAQVEETFGDYALFVMTVTHEQGIACQMCVESQSIAYVRQLNTRLAHGIRKALMPLLVQRPKPRFTVRWEPAAHLWKSEFNVTPPPSANGEPAVTAVNQTHPNRHPLFALGQVVATPGALDALTAAGQTPAELIDRHVTGDWHELPPEDRAENLRSLEHGNRIFSAYTLANQQRIWVITEWDRSVTTLLLPADY